MNRGQLVREGEALPALSTLRETGRLRVDVEVPLLVITICVLLLIAQQRVIAVPTWLVPLGGDDKK